MQLSKSRYVAGLQCPRLLWLKVHEPDAKELKPDKVLQDRFDQGAEVGRLAQERWPDGVLIDLPHWQVREKAQRTREAIESGARVIFEASFIADDTFVAVDVLVREDDGWRLIEVKSSNSQKDEHLPDAAVQLHVLRRCGLTVKAVEIMHLNKQFSAPAREEFVRAGSSTRLSADPALFVRTPVTDLVGPLLPSIPEQLQEQLAMLAGPEPTPAIGRHCQEPRDCPFMGRCWPSDRGHISKLNGVGKVKCQDYFNQGITRIDQLPPPKPGKKVNAIVQRQIRSMREDTLIVEPTLAEALAPFTGRLGYLDFETISRAVPPWAGMKPWEMAAAQFSFHLDGANGHSHFEFLAEGADDTRPALARAMIEATRSADWVVTYSGFEKARIRSLQETVPELRDELVALEHKLIDLLPVIRENVYHPAFAGSFSLKFVLPALCPELSYKDLVIVDGAEASVEIARLLFCAGKIAPGEHERVRGDLLAYCQQDTWAMVRLLETLRGLSA
jgi:predicted RecB family nuclease